MAERELWGYDPHEESGHHPLWDHPDRAKALDSLNYLLASGSTGNLRRHAKAALAYGPFHGSVRQVLKVIDREDPSGASWHALTAASQPLDSRENDIFKRIHEQQGFPIGGRQKRIRRPRGFWKGGPGDVDLSGSARKEQRRYARPFQHHPLWDHPDRAAALRVARAHAFGGVGKAIGSGADARLALREGPLSEATRWFSSQLNDVNPRHANLIAGAAAPLNDHEGRIAAETDTDAPDWEGGATEDYADRRWHEGTEY